MRRVVCSACLGLSLLGSTAEASPLDFDVTSFRADGVFSIQQQIATLEQTVTGTPSGAFRRSFYLFEIPSLALPVASARIVFAEGNGFARRGSDQTRTLGIWNFSGNTNLLENWGKLPVEQLHQHLRSARVGHATGLHHRVRPERV